MMMPEMWEALLWVCKHCSCGSLSCWRLLTAVLGTGTLGAAGHEHTAALHLQAVTHLNRLGAGAGELSPYGRSGGRHVSLVTHMHAWCSRACMHGAAGHVQGTSDPVVSSHTAATHPEVEHRHADPVHCLFPRPVGHEGVVRHVYLAIIVGVKELAVLSHLWVCAGALDGVGALCGSAAGK